MSVMQNSDSLFEALEQIATTSKKNEKIAMLSVLLTDSFATDVVKYALSPMYVYGVAETTVNIPNVSGPRTFDGRTLDLLQALASNSLTGNAATDAIHYEMCRLTIPSQKLLQRVLLKDLRCGVAAGLVNTVVPGLIVEYPYMRCSVLKQIKSVVDFVGEKAYSQTKADGMFLNVIRHGTRLPEYMSRQGKMVDSPFLGELTKEVLNLKPSTVSHGEILIVREGRVLSRYEGNGLLSSVFAGNRLPDSYTPKLQLWDQIPIEYFVPGGKYAVPYEERFDSLSGQILSGNRSLIELIDTEVVTNVSEAVTHFASIVKTGGEGTVLKKAKAVWRDGDSREQLKLKLEAVVDLEIIGIQYGLKGTRLEGKPAGFRCATIDRELIIDAAIKNEAIRLSVIQDMTFWIGKIVAIRSNGITPPNPQNPVFSLTHPRMAEPGYRADKDKADTVHDVFDQFDSAAQSVEWLGI